MTFPLVTAGLFMLPVLFPALEHWLTAWTLRSLVVVALVCPAPVRTLGSIFSVGATSVEIVPECTALAPTLLMMGGMLTFPASLRSKVIGIVLGSVGLWLYNLLRVYLLMFVLRHAPAHFDIVHVFLWQSLTILAVVAVFFTWAMRARAPSER